MGVGAFVLAAGLAVAGCAPAKVGAAAVVGNQRVTVANLDTEASQLAAAAKKYPGVVNLTQQEITQDTLQWLIRFQITDTMARDNGITVSNAQVQTALSQILTAEQEQAAQEGITGLTLEEVLVGAGIAPNLQQQAGQYEAIETQYLTNANGGKVPTESSTNLATLENEFNHAQCQAAKSLNITVNPQFGVLDYSTYSVVTGPDTLSRPSGPKVAASPIPTTPAC
jgi:hypothetical protein